VQNNRRIWGTSVNGGKEGGEARKRCTGRRRRGQARRRGKKVETRRGLGEGGVSGYGFEVSGTLEGTEARKRGLKKGTR